MKNSYVYTPSGQILTQYSYDEGAEPNEPNEQYFYIHDRLGSVRLVVNEDGDVNNTYTYEPFGSEFPTECNETVYNPFKFTGQWFDSEINQYYLRARMYDPVLMRFTDRDPEDGELEEPLSLHKYLYCLNDPINRIDPNGLWYIDIGGTIGYWGGIAFGLMIGSEGIDVYFGGGFVPPYGGFSVTGTLCDPTIGWNIALQGGYWGGGQGGYGFGDGWFWEVGLVSPGASLAGFYVWELWNW